jgi:hypothetical protein
MQVVQSLDEKKWRRFINDHQESNVFHTPELFRVFARTKNHIPELWAALDYRGNVLVLFLPVNVTLFRKLRVLTTRAVVYGSVLLNQGSLGLEALTLLLNTYKRNVGKSLVFTELRNLSDLMEAQPVLQECGFEFADELNYKFRLERDVDSVLQRIGRATRKHIRRGLRQGLVEISDVKDCAELEEWYGLLEKIYSRARVPLADRSLFEAAYDVLVPRKMAKFLVGRVNEKLVVCSLILLYKDQIFVWYGGVDRSYGKYNPSELMIWHEMKWGAENGYRVFDFGLAGNPNVEYGVRDFKAKFKGKEVCYGRNTHIHLPGVFRMIRLGYEGYRTVLRFTKQKGV